MSATRVTGPPSVVLRPRRWRQYGIVAAVVIVGIAVVSAATFAGTKASNGGRVDAPVERVALVAVGLAFAGVALWLGHRPRICADATAIEIRNIVGEYTVTWDAVSAIRIPRGGFLANLELTSGEVIGLAAVQRIDAGHAVKAIEALRAIHRAATEPPETNPAR